MIYRSLICACLWEILLFEIKLSTHPFERHTVHLSKIMLSILSYFPSTLSAVFDQGKEVQAGCYHLWLEGGKEVYGLDMFHSGPSSEHSFVLKVL